MSNIYLKLPQYVCDFYRGREDEKLEPNDPVVFADYSEEMHILKAGLRCLPPDTYRKNYACYSQRDWNAIREGRRPGSNEKIMARNNNDRPTIEDVYTIEGLSMSDRLQNFDYLCIQIPTSVYIGGKIVKTTPSFTLSSDMAARLEGKMREEFIFCLIDWMAQDRRVCLHKGINRSRIETLERFLCQYDITISNDHKERESLRRMINRWLRKTNALPNDRFDFATMSYLAHATEEEARRLEEPIECFTEQEFEGIHSEKH